MSAYLTVKNVADRWGIAPQRVNRLVSAGALRGVRIGHNLRFRADLLPESPPTVERKPRPSRYPDLPPSGVYMLFIDGALTYIGRSTDLPKRIGCHRRSGRAFDEVRAIPCDPTLADWLEAELVRTLAPPENIKRFERRARRIEAGLQALLA